MIVDIRPLEDGAKQTGRRMRLIVDNYAEDIFSEEMDSWGTLTLSEIFDKVKSLPFDYDPPGNEWIRRAKFTRAGRGPGRDCDDKSIIIASWAKVNNIPYRFVAVGKRVPGQGFFSRSPLTHVYVEVYIDGTWIPVDATYSFNVLGQTVEGIARRELI